MKETTKQDCPLCAAAAEFYLVDYNTCKYFKCSACGLFQISLRGERVLSGAPQQWRDEFTRRARAAPEDHALVIRVPTIPPDSEGARPALEGKFVSMSELPQG